MAQLAALVELDEEPDDEQPAASNVAAATPASADRYEDFTSASCKASLSPKWIAAARKGPGRRYQNGLPTHLFPS